MIVTKPYVLPSSILDNIAYLAWKMEIINSQSYFSMNDGIVDGFQDQTGIDTGTSVNQYYDSTNKLYSSTQSLDSDYLLYLKFNSSYLDSSASPLTITNHSTTFDTSIKKLGSASMNIASGQYLEISDFNHFVGTSSGFFAGFFRFTTDQDCVLLHQGSSSSDQFYIRYSASGHTINVFSASGGSTQLSFTIPFTPSTGTWYHIAFNRNGTTEWAGFIEGVKQTVTYTTGSASTSLANQSGSVFIGYRPYAADLQFLGKVDNIEFSRVSRQTATFTPPTIEYGTNQNITLISQPFTAVTPAYPSTVNLIIFEEDVDAITLNTDLLAYVSRDSGTTWTQGTIVNQGNYQSGRKILSATINISSQPSGGNMKYKLVTANTKALNIRGVGFLWQ